MPLLPPIRMALKTVESAIFLDGSCFYYCYSFSTCKYSETPISRTLDFSKTPITQTKSSFPWICFTVLLPPIFRTPDFLNQFSFPLEVREIGIPLYHVKCIFSKHCHKELAFIQIHIFCYTFDVNYRYLCYFRPLCLS